jgi:hypothetical protein
MKTIKDLTVIIPLLILLTSFLTLIYIIIYYYFFGVKIISFLTTDEIILAFNESG